jgi:hypothetical protein
MHGGKLHALPQLNIFIYQRLTLRGNTLARLATGYAVAYAAYPVNPPLGIIQDLEIKKTLASLVYSSGTAIGT